MTKQYEESVSSSNFSPLGSKFSENNLRNNLFEGIHYRISMTPVLGFLVRNLYRTPHYPPNKKGNALPRCLKEFLTTKTLTRKNSEQNDYKTAKTSGIT